MIGSQIYNTLYNLSYNTLYIKMTKKAQQKKQQQQAMREVLKKLSITKQRNKKLNIDLTSITAFNQKKAMRKKLKLINPSFIEAPPIPPPAINIFQQEQFDTGRRFQPQPQSLPVPHLDLQMRAARELGLSLQKFGDKPLKQIHHPYDIIEEEETNPNPHPNIAKPTHRNTQPKAPSASRQQLPIYMREQELIECISDHLVTLVSGETGSGKSTQLPQFLVENNYHTMGCIAITQPRRLATLSLASRVAQEMQVELGTMVGYQIRHHKKQSPNTTVKFMTDGILLNEMNSDPLLKKYGVVIIDEAHQRKVNTDILIGLLSRVVIVRYQQSLTPLRLIIMSATMRVEDFNHLFNFHVPIVHIQAKMYPVTIYHQKTTPQDYVTAAIQKCTNIHLKLPPGDVLVFLTGKEQIDNAAQSLTNSLAQLNSEQEYIVHRLYSSLQMRQQEAVFEAFEGRKFILSTNIAETSLTIPNVRYVVDAGHEKHKYFDGIWKWRKGWTSRAAAEQRAGRAGRTAPGSCYRLYSAAVFANTMPPYSSPEIVRLPLSTTALQLKAIGVTNLLTFPFPTPPQPPLIHACLAQLIEIGALTTVQNNSNRDDTTITELGRILAMIPLQPKLGKLLLMGRKCKVEKHCLILVILLTVQNIFLSSNKNKYLNTFKSKYIQYIQEDSDILTCINVVGTFFRRLFCQSQGHVMSRINTLSHELQLNQSVMRQIYLNADQICQIYATICNETVSLQCYTAPTNSQCALLHDILLQTFISNICQLESADNKPLYRNKENEVVHIHSNSLCYQRKSLFMGCTDFIKSTKTHMRYPFAVHNYALLAQFGTVAPCHDFIVKEGKVVGVANAQIYTWNIPNVIVEDAENYFHAAKLLLQGKIAKPFKALEKYYAAPVSTIREDNLEYRVQKIVETLKTYKINSLEALKQRWSKDKWFLKAELELWVKVNSYQEVYKKIRNSVLE